MYTPEEDHTVEDLSFAQERGTYINKCLSIISIIETLTDRFQDVLEGLRNEDDTTSMYCELLIFKDSIETLNIAMEEATIYRELNSFNSELTLHIIGTRVSVIINEVEEMIEEVYGENCIIE